MLGGLPLLRLRIGWPVSDNTIWVEGGGEWGERSGDAEGDVECGRWMGEGCLSLRGGSSPWRGGNERVVFPLLNKGDESGVYVSMGESI